MANYDKINASFCAELLYDAQDLVDVEAEKFYSPWEREPLGQGEVGFVWTHVPTGRRFKVAVTEIDEE